MTTTATLETIEVRLNPGEEIAIPVRIHNTGEIVEGYQIEVVGAPSAWAEVQPETLSLYPGTSTTAVVTFRPPRTHVLLAGEQPFGVIVTPTEHPDEAVVPEGVVEVLPFLDTIAELIPRTSQGRRRGRHQVAVHNRGNVPVTALLDGRDDGDQLERTFRPPAVTVGPGEARFADVRVKPRLQLWSGGPVTCPFQVVVSAQGSMPVVLDGMHVQQPLVPSWLPKALAALVALLVALAAVWFLLLKPTIESQAEEAVADEVEQADAAAEQAETEAEQAGQEAEQAQQTAAQVEQDMEEVEGDRKDVKRRVERGLPPTLRARAVTERLSSDGSAADSYAVPPRWEFAITDMVFSNPQGDFGRARVLINGEPRFEIALENFRDLDYHFQTPVEVAPEQTAQLEVECREPGKPPDAPQADACDIALFLGGTLVEQPPPRPLRATGQQ